MFESLSRSWAFACDSYRILGRHKRLILLPILATLAGLLVMLSFALPLWSTGQLDFYLQAIDDDGEVQLRAVDYALMFAFYFSCYFVIVFFNSALIACTMQAISGQEPSLSYGLSMAGKRLPQIAMWALVSAIIGTLLRAIENTNDKVPKFIAAILGMAWSAMTYFVVPVIVMDGLGPVASVKQSIKTLRNTWGTALVGNFSLGLLGFLMMIPVMLLAWLVLHVASSAGLLIVGIVLAAAIVLTGASITSAADTVFKALLFNYATGKETPANIDTSVYETAFTSKR